MIVSRIASVAAVATLIAGLATMASAQERKPQVIHVGSGSSGTGSPQTGATMGVMQRQELLEQEFAKDGVRIEWSFFKGLGPAQNEAFANGTLDVGFQGDMSAIIGRGSGLKIKVLAASHVRSNNYVGVRTDSAMKSIRDLKGKRIAVQIGGPTFLFLNRLLESQGLSARDVTVYNISGANAIAAVQAGRADVVMGANLIDLARQGAIRIIYSTRDAPDLWKNISVLVATEDFINRYPEATEKVVQQWVKAADWGSREENRQALFELWARGGTPVSSWEQEYAGRSGLWITTPLLDPFIYEHLRKDIELSKRLGVIRSTFSVDDWIDPRFLQQALRDLELENHWIRYDSDGG